MKPLKTRPAMLKSVFLVLSWSIIFVFGNSFASTSQEIPCKDKCNITGKFTGILSCLDCPGIETTITINEDGTYQLTKTYINKNIASLKERGIVHKTDSKRKLLLVDHNHNKTYIRIQKNGILILERNGKPVNTKKSDNYLLHPVKTNDSSDHLNQITKQKWQLSQLTSMSDKIPDNLSPFIKFNTETKQINGFGGCNNFFGEYELGIEGHIRISQISSTKKFCSETMELETAFTEMLKNCMYYELQPNKLILKDKTKKQLAIFFSTEK
ncbi:META domain-containing protein [Thermophagus sp. OGC60D27]|uniref:META domain-containing protein n=1 Tax=Thermophagus sp. OGC60D27 TaxID=3458415 RepID=UPI00403790D1